MRRLAILLALSVAVPLHAGGFKKPYFGLTKPGSWAKYAVKDAHNGTSYTATYVRLPDAGGNMIFETTTEFPREANTPTNTTRFEVPATFDVAKNGISFAKYTVAASGWSPNGEVVPVSAGALERMHEQLPDYDSVVTFRGTENLSGRSVDRYTYVVSAPRGMRQSGELWLSDDVPFGLVREVSTSEYQGTVLAKSELTLTASGTSGGKAAPRPPEPAPLTLFDALVGGLIGIDAVVLDGGKRLQLEVVRTTGNPVRLWFPAGAVDLEIGDVVGVLRLQMPSERIVDVPFGGTAKFEIAQRPGRGVVAGGFRLREYKRKPMFSGEVKMGNVPGV